jgi:hypothetical protein
MTAGDEAGPGRSHGDRGPGKDAGRNAAEPAVTVIVDGANVVGSRPDGWWRDRAGAAVRLHDELAKLAVRGAAGIAAELLATGEGDEPSGPPDALRDASGLVPVDVVLVLEGAARAAAPRIAERARTAEGGRGRDGDGIVRVASAPGSGDDEIVRLAQGCRGRCIVVTADRELRRRCLAAGARVAGPSWLYALL